MKKEIIDIIEKELGDSRIKKDVLDLSVQLIEFYDERRSVSKSKFIKTLQKYNFETMSKFAEYPEYPHVTLFHGSGGLEFWPVIDYEGGVSDVDQEIGTIIEEPTFWLNDDDYEYELKDEAIQWNWEIRERIVFIWLSTIWQEIKGYDYGIVVKTLENNSVRQYIFNDLSWDNLSSFTNYNNKKERLLRYFERDLTIEEINVRVKKKR